MKRKNLSLGLSILLTALVLVQGAMAYPSQTNACTNCHTLSSSISISTTSPATVTPGQIFDVSITWSGGSSATAVKWPSVNDNAAFGLDPGVVVSSSASGTAISTLTAPSAEGSYTVTVYVSTLSGGPITNFKDIAITVRAATPTPTPTATPTPVLTTIDVLPPVAYLIVGANQVFTATPKDQNGNPITATLTWTSSNTTVGNIDANGIFSASAAGSTTIKASSGTVSGIASVTVTTSVIVPVLSTITISPATANLSVNGTQSFLAKTLDQFNQAISAIVTWASSNTTVGTIDANGKFTALAEGTTVITATNGTIYGSANVTVSRNTKPGDDDDEDEVDDDIHEHEHEHKHKHKHHDKKNNSEKKHKDKIKEKKHIDK